MIVIIVIIMIMIILAIEIMMMYDTVVITYRDNHDDLVVPRKRLIIIKNDIS